MFIILHLSQISASFNGGNGHRNVPPDANSELEFTAEVTSTIPGWSGIVTYMSSKAVCHCSAVARQVYGIYSSNNSLSIAHVQTGSTFV